MNLVPFEKFSVMNFLNLLQMKFHKLDAKTMANGQNLVNVCPNSQHPVPIWAIAKIVKVKIQQFQITFWHPSKMELLKKLFIY